MTPEYLAGFFDGEGCIDCQKLYPSAGKGRLYVRPRVRVAQVAAGRVVIDRLHAVYGGSISFRAHNPAKQRDSVSWEFLGAENIKSFLRPILPHLVLKAEQAKLCLWWLDNAAHLHSRGKVRPHLATARLMFYEELKAMKKDPNRLSSEAITAITPYLV